MKIPPICQMTRYFLMVFAGTIFLLGCSSIVGYKRLYTGKPKSLRDVAILTHINPYAQSIVIGTIDEKPALFTGLVELTPGKHNICAGYITSSRKSDGCTNLEFNADAGHVYIIYGVHRTVDNTWYPVIQDITNELAAPEQGKLTEKIDAILGKNRPQAPKIKVRDLAPAKMTKPIKGFYEEVTLDLSPWLKKTVTVTFNFSRYRPFVLAEASDGHSYHLQVNQETGEIVNVFGKQVEVKGLKCFQPLNSKLAAFCVSGVVHDRFTNGLVYQQHTNGKYILMERHRATQFGEFGYHALLEEKWLKNLSDGAISALVLAKNAESANLTQYDHVQNMISGLSKEQATHMLRHKSIELGLEAVKRAKKAVAESSPEAKASHEQALARCEISLKGALRDGNLMKVPSIVYGNIQVRFFASDNEITPYQERQYKSSFSKQETTYVGWQIDLDMQPPKEKLPYLVKALWFDPAGTLIYHQSLEAFCGAGVNNPWHAHILGYTSPGQWATGTYQVVFYLNGNHVAKQNFTIQ